MIAFDEFLREARGRDPYPWQSRLAHRCLESGPPELIGAPTGAGKTTTVDALVWALAAQAERPTSERTVGVRVVWAVDRRILVDQIYEDAVVLAERLDTACDDASDALHELARRLLRLAGGLGVSADERRRRGLHPLVATQWRGGLASRPDIPAPFQPEIITSTVAQIGSRLLFRGYGVGERSLALAAGLASCDTTICLDEAHLAEPFRQTVGAVCSRRERERRTTPLAPLRLVTLTATPAGAGDGGISVDDADFAVAGFHRRWAGEKWLELRETPGPPADQLASAVKELLDADARVVACVANRVNTARDAAKRLRKVVDADVMLLMGPQRPADRARQLEEFGPVLFNGEVSERPLVCVATQTFEVGLDADVDGLVTQSASASAIVQRLGRLNRSGARPGRAIVLRDETSPLYRDDEPACWAWLQSRCDEDGVMDASVRAITTDAGRPADRKTARAPLLTDAIVAQLAQTSPRPAPLAEPDVDGLLRGAETPPAADVTILWRCDLHLDESSDEADAYRRALLRLVPPQREELLTLSVPAARLLITHLLGSGGALRQIGAEADVESGGRKDERVPEPSGERRDFVVLRGDELLEGTVRGLRAGDIVVASTDLGGCDDEGLDPAAKPTSDVGGDLRAPSDRAWPVRLSREVLTAAGGTVTAGRLWQGVASVAATLARDAGDILTAEEAERLVTAVTPPGGDAAVVPGLRATAQWRLRQVFTAEDVSVDRSAWVLLPVSNRSDDVGARTDPPTLEEHARAVGARVGAYATAANLPAPERAALTLAGLAHDHGKADTRIQAWFAGGFARIGAEPLAKSTFGTGDPLRSRRARRLAGAPRSLRHEIASVAALADAARSRALPPEADGADLELALHLVGTHHGLGRPLPRVPVDEGRPPAPFRVGVGGVHGRALGDGLDGWDNGAWWSRFFALHGRLGPWTLGYLEALLVLADRTVSREGG